MTTKLTRTTRKKAPATEEVVATFVAKKLEAARLAEELKVLQGQIMAAVPVNTSRTFDLPDYIVTATTTAASSSTIDEEALKEALGARLYNKLTTTITTVTLDQDKLVSAIKEGKVSASVVDSVTETKTNAPYVRTTIKQKGGK